MLKFLRVALPAFLFLASLAAAGYYISEQDEVSRNAKILILDRKYRDAAAALSADPGTGEQAATRRFLKGHALLLAGDGKEAAAAFESYIKDYPQGPDAARARHGVAASKRLLKDFAGAAAIEQAELQKLLSPERRLELAKVYLDYAVKSEKATIPNLARALVFCDLAISLELPKDEDERVRMKTADLAERLNQLPDALNRLNVLQIIRGDGPGGFTKFRIASLKRLTGDVRGARRGYRDFLKEYPNAEKASDAAYGIGLTFGMPNPPDDDSLAQGVAAYQDLIVKFPKSDQARAAAFEIPSAELVRGRLDEALRDFQAFISSAPKDDKDQRIAVARARVGSILYQQGKYNDAIAAWKLYLAEHPTHGEFANVNRAIVDAEYAIAMKAVAEALENVKSAKEKGDAARAAIQTFLSAHPLDERHARTAMYLAGIEEMRERYDVAREELERIASRYVNTDESAQAQFHVGRIYEERTFDYEKAIEAYKRVGGGWADRAKQRIAALQEKTLSVKTARTFRADEEPAIEVTSRNIEKLRLRAFKLDLETFFRSKLASPAIETLDVEVIEPDLRRDVSASPYVPHKQSTESVKLTEFKGKPGAYVVKVDDGELEASSLVLVSNLVLIVKGAKDGVLVFAQDAMTGEAAMDTKIVVSDGKAVLLEDKTGPDGVLLKTNAWTVPVERLVVYGSSRYGAAVSGMDIATLTKTEALRERTLVITDRSSYRPGDAVHAYAISRGVKENQYRVDEGREVKATLSDPSGIAVRTVVTKLSPFGTMTANLELPANANFGTWTVSVSDPIGKGLLGARTVEVEEVRRDRLKIEVNLEKAVVMRGEAVKGNIKVRYFSGGPAAKRQVAVALEANDNVLVTTDDAGVGTFTLETKELSEEGVYPIIARLDEEGVYGVGNLTVATVGFRPSIRVMQSVVLAKEPIEVIVEARDAAKKPYAAELQIQVLRREEKGGLRKTQTVAAQTDAKTGEQRTRITIADGGNYVLRVEGKDAFGSVVVAETSVTVSGDDDVQKLRIFVDKGDLKFGESLKARVVSRMGAEHSTLVTFDGDGILSYQIIRIPRGESFLDFKVDEKLAPQATLSLAAVDDWKLYTADRKVSVSKGLVVEMKPPKDPIAPGAETQIEFTVKDGHGNAASAEVLISAVDSAFLAKRPDTNSNLQSFFYPSTREAGTRVSSSCGFVYNAQTRRIASDLAAEEGRLKEATERARAASPGAPPTSGFAANRPGLSRDPATDELAGLLLKMDDGRAKNPGQGAILTDSVEYAGNSAYGADHDALKEAEKAPVGGGGGSRGNARRVSGGKSVLSSESKMKNLSDKKAGKPGGDRLDWRGGESERGLEVNNEEGIISESMDDGESAAAVRKDFIENACFEIGLSDSSGAGKIKLKAPDSTTEWTLTGRGVSKLTELGEGSSTFTTHRDIEISLRLPSVVVEGDRLDSTVVVRNATTNTHKIETEIALDGATGGGSITLELNAGQEGTASRPITVGGSERMKITATAKSGSSQDAMERSIDIRPAGSVVSDVASTVVRNSSLLDVALPEFSKLRNPTLKLYLSPGFDADILEDSARFVKMYGGSSMLYDSPGWAITRGEVALDRLAYVGRVGLSDEATIARMRQTVQDSIARVSIEQSAVGDMNWSGNRSTSFSRTDGASGSSKDTATSARAFAFLGRARVAGFEVPELVIQRFMKWARERMRSTESSTERVRLLLALAENDSVDQEVLQRLQRSRAELSDTALALLAIIDNRIGRKDLALEVVETLKRKQNANPETLPWGNDYESGTDSVEATGYAIAAIAEVNPSESLLQKAVDQLRQTRKARATDRGEAAAIRALVSYFRNTKVDRSQFKLTIDCNDQPIKSLDSSELKGEWMLEIPRERISEKNRLRISLTGRGEVAAMAVFSGVQSSFKQKDNGVTMTQRSIEPAYLTYKGKPIPRGYSVVEQREKRVTYDVKNLPVGTEAIVHVHANIRNSAKGLLDYSYIEEPIPAGCEVVPNSIQGNFERVVVRNGSIIAALPSSAYSGELTYKILAVRTGEYTFAPSVLRLLYRPNWATESEARKLSILTLGSSSPDKFERTPDEFYYEGIARYDNGERVEGAKLLREVCAMPRIRAEFLREATRRVLADAIERNDSAEAIVAFERLRDRFADLTLPFETVVKVGNAYLSSQQSEMADIVFRGIAGALYRREANVAGALLKENEFLAAVKFLSALHDVYPQMQETLVAIHELAGLVAATATNIPKGLKGVTKAQLLTMACDLELDFLTRDPESSIAPEAAFGYLSAELDLEHFTQVIQGCVAFARRYSDSNLIDKVLYLEGYARFASGEPKEALEILKKVVTQEFTTAPGVRGPSPYRDRATLLCAQILHATGDIRGAVVEYEKVRNAFTDASDAVQNFRDRSLTLPPVKVLGMAESAEFIVHSKNIDRANLRVYRVDLMRLYLMEKNLDRMTGIDLSGISPLLVKDIELGTKDDFIEKDTPVTLELKDKGAYLVVVRTGSDAGAQPLAGATLLLRTDLKLEVREDISAGRIWINVRDSKNSSVPKADVRVVGSRDGSVKLGITDLRGVYIADGVHGRATVVAQVTPTDANDKSGPSFAFFRGNSDLVPQPIQPQKDAQRKAVNFDEEAVQELRSTNFLIQDRNRTQLENKLQTKQTGVELDRVK